MWKTVETRGKTRKTCENVGENGTAVWLKLTNASRRARVRRRQSAQKVSAPAEDAQDDPITDAGDSQQRREGPLETKLLKVNALGEEADFDVSGLTAAAGRPSHRKRPSAISALKNGSGYGSHPGNAQEFVWPT